MILSYELFTVGLFIKDWRVLLVLLSIGDREKLQLTTSYFLVNLSDVGDTVKPKGVTEACNHYTLASDVYNNQ